MYSVVNISYKRVMENKSYAILKSNKDKLKKAIFFEDNIEKYYSVAFFVEEENDCVICVSSQVGCTERCMFCATGDQPFIRNLSRDEIVSELQIGMKMISDMVSELDNKQISVIFEGMGEASHNIENCFAAFDYVYPTLSEKFNKIVLRVASSGNVDLCRKYLDFFFSRKDKCQNVSFQVKLSLHTPYEKERKYLMPNISKRYSLENIISSFEELAKSLGTKLICNYVMFSYPNGGNNYSAKHAIELVKCINRDTMKITLGQYSETGKGFASPEEREYRLFLYYLSDKCGIETDVVKLYGQDINAACGMLNYQIDKVRL